MDTPVDSATTATATMTTHNLPPLSDVDDMSTYSATTTPLSPPSPNLRFTNQTTVVCPAKPAPFDSGEACREPLPSLSQLFMPQMEPGSRQLPEHYQYQPQHQQQKSLPSFRQFVHQTHSPETPQSLSQFPSFAHDRRHSLPSFSQLVAQIEDRDDQRRRLPSFADLMAGAPVDTLPWKNRRSSDRTLRLTEREDNDDRWSMAGEDIEIAAEKSRSQQNQQQRQQYPSRIDNISMLAAAAAEIERDTDNVSDMARPDRRSLVSTYNSPIITSTASATSSSPYSSSTDVSAKKPQRQSAKKQKATTSTTTHRSSIGSSGEKSSTWLWRRPSDDRWVQRKQSSPPKRERSDEYEDYEMTHVKHESDEEMEKGLAKLSTRPRTFDLPPKKRKSSLTTAAISMPPVVSGSGSKRPMKRSAESTTDDTRSEMLSEVDQQQSMEQPSKTKKKRTSKPKDPNYVSPSGFRHGGERRIQEPDEVVEMPPDVGPVSMLQGPNLPKVFWKGTSLPVEGKPGAERLHPHEAYIASTLRLSPAQYLLCKKTLILASREFQANHKVFRKTDAQKLCHVDVNKASKLWEVFTKIGWLAGNTDEDSQV
ncbi:hypothetical protein BGW42_008483 [Actinomortierella wolfii]|nr:hypothetical protein BGW42_008483 [Actinomortierella wolfii]